MTNRWEEERRCAELEWEIRRLKSQMQAATQSVPMEDRNGIAAVHTRADSLYQMLGDSVPQPLPGERLHSYRMRVADGLKRHSNTFRNYQFADWLDDKALALVEERIYADAEDAAKNPDKVPPGVLREVQTTENGKHISRFYGDQRVTWAPFMPPMITRVTFNRHPHGVHPAQHNSDK